MADGGGVVGVGVASGSASVAARSLTALVLVVSLAACGFRSSGADEVWLPYCRQVWVPGASLPADYIGCQMGAVGWSWLQFSTPCQSGSALYVFNEDEWAWPGGKVHAVSDAADDPAYRAAWRRCRGIH